MFWKLIIIVLLAPVASAYLAVADTSSYAASIFAVPDMMVSQMRPVYRVFRSPLDDESSDPNYDARCFCKRNPKFRQDPVLHYFAYKSHSVETLGCHEGEGSISFTLHPKEASGDDDGQAYEQEIKSKLLEPGLYDPSVPTYLIVHGFLSDWNKNPWMCNIKDTVLNSSLANVFITDWSGGAKPVLPMDYSKAVSNTKIVAQVVTGFLRALLRLSEQSDGRLLHLIGHSLGAHISGFIGYGLGGSVGRITGLDPAGPCFTSTRGPGEKPGVRKSGNLKSPRRRLSSSSAKLVVAYHTDCSLFGLNENCAHYDVYINGGSSQAGCTSLSDLGTRLLDLIDRTRHEGRKDLDLNLVCAHSYAHKMIDGSAFVPNSKATGLLNGAIKPDKCQPMAYECTSWATFVAGECGLCHDNQPECIYLGMQLDRVPAEQLAHRAPESERAGDYDMWKPDGDDMANGEVVNPGNATYVAKLSDVVARGRHFIRLGASSPFCRYHYQVVVGVKLRAETSSTLSPSLMHNVYLQLPVQEKQVRLVRISHVLRPGSPAYARLKRQLTDPALFPSPPSLDGLELYTALITFGSSDYCGPTQGRPSEWTLCEPLQKLTNTRIWSSSESRVAAVEWVALNLMSAYSAAERRKGSRLLVLRVPPAARAKLDAEQRPELSQLRPPRSLDPLDCLVGSASELGRIMMRRQAPESSSDLNLLCDRSDEELSHWAPLEAIEPSAS